MQSAGSSGSNGRGNARARGAGFVPGAGASNTLNFGCLVRAPEASAKNFYHRAGESLCRANVLLCKSLFAFSARWHNLIQLGGVFGGAFNAVCNSMQHFNAGKTPCGKRLPEAFALNAVKFEVLV